MYQALSLCALLFISRKLKEAGIPSTILNVSMILYVLWEILGFVVAYDIARAEVDIFPLHFAEIIRSVDVTVIIIILLGFFAFFGVDLITGFRGYTKQKALLALFLLACVTIYGMGEAYFVRRRDITIPTTKLPEGLDRLRVVFLSDVHIGGLSTLMHLERVIKIVEEAGPDILLLGGDTLDGDMSYRAEELALLKSAAGKARYGAFAVNGNHEHYWLLDVDVEGIIRECGYHLLIDERVETAGITIIGMEDIKKGWLKVFLKSEDASRFVLVLKHRPGLPFDAEGRFDLQLSGHTHGGQFWPLGYFKNMVAGSTQGLSRKAGGWVYVSNGSGFNHAMMRLFVPPEVTVIDIVREK